MNPARATDQGYIQFLIGSPKVVSATEAACVRPKHPQAPAHDAFTRLLHRLEPDPGTLGQEVRPLIDPKSGVLSLTTPRSTSLVPATRPWLGITGPGITTPSFGVST